MTTNRVENPDDVCVIALQKGGERWAVFYACNAAGKREALRQLGKWAANKELSFNWYDAAVLSQKMGAK